MVFQSTGKCVVDRDRIPDWARLWDDFFQEEIREGAHQGDQKKKGQDEENLARASKGKKKSNKEKIEGSSSKSGKKKDLSKIKMFLLPLDGSLCQSMSE